MPNWIVKSLQRPRKLKLGHSISPIRGSNKGVSTLIAMMAFVLVFMLAMAYSFFLIQNTNEYALTVKEQTEFRMQQLDEILLTATVLKHNINVSNPTALPITITQIWSDDHYNNLNETTAIVVPPYSTIMITHLDSENGTYTLITERGNKFKSEPGFEPPTIATSIGGHWDVVFWARNSSTYEVGNSIWRQLSFSRSYDNSSWGVPNLVRFGFNASTMIVPTNDHVIVYVGIFDPAYESHSSEVFVYLNNTCKNQIDWNPITSSQKIFFCNVSTAEIYSLNVTYSTNTTTTNPRTITIEVINADFFQYNSTPLKFIPTVTTSLNESHIMVNEPVYDNVTVTGDGSTTLTGTVEFQVRNDTGLWETYNATILDVNGNATSSVYTPTKIGYYYFRAVYSGDGNYTKAQSGDTDEPLIVGPIPTVITMLNATNITFGGYVKDNVTVSATGPTPTGTVQFQYKFGNGAWTNHGAPVNLTGGFANSSAFQPDKLGTWYFQAIYSGDSNYLYATSNITAYETVIVKATPTVTTLLNTTGPIKLGAVIHDTATVTGLGGSFPVPTGTVTFWVTLPNGTTLQLDTKPLSGGQAVSSDYTPLVKGTYYFNATYNGDGNYLNAVNKGMEKLIVTASFGNTIMGSSTADIGDIIRGSNFTLTAGNAYANSSTVALYCSKSRTVTVNTAIYYANNGTLVASTTAQSLSLDTTITWFTFNFSTPPLLVNNTLYRLVVWASPPSGATVGVAYVAGAGAHKSQTYGAFPGTLNGMTANTNTYSIYLTIT